MESIQHPCDGRPRAGVGRDPSAAVWPKKASFLIFGDMEIKGKRDLGHFETTHEKAMPLPLILDR